MADARAAGEPFDGGERQDGGNGRAAHEPGGLARRAAEQRGEEEGAGNAGQGAVGDGIGDQRLAAEHGEGAGSTGRAAERRDADHHDDGVEAEAREEAHGRATSGTP